MRSEKADSVQGMVIFRPGDAAEASVTLTRN